MPVLLDTTVLIDALRGRPGVLSRLDAIESRGEAPLTCAINIEELVRGLRPHEAEAAERLLQGLHVARLGRLEGIRAGAWRRQSTQRGMTLSQSDCLVGAAAVSAGARLATGNPKHFPFDELTVEHWPVGA